MMMRAIMHALLSLSASKYAFKRTKHLLRVLRGKRGMELLFFLEPIDVSIANKNGKERKAQSDIVVNSLAAF